MHFLNICPLYRILEPKAVGWSSPVTSQICTRIEASDRSWLLIKCKGQRTKCAMAYESNPTHRYTLKIKSIKLPGKLTDFALHQLVTTIIERIFDALCISWTLNSFQRHSMGHVQDPYIKKMWKLSHLKSTTFEYTGFARSALT